MGRRNLNILSDWQDCLRCDRSRSRLRVLTPPWPIEQPERQRIVILTSAASRASQAADTIEPQLVDLAREVEGRLGLPNAALIIDHLVACGLGEATPDTVAACSARFAALPQPDALLLVGERTAALAKDAGLLRNGVFTLFGSWSVAVDTVADADAALAALATRFGLVYRASSTGPSRANIQLASQHLLHWVGAHTGHRVRNSAQSDWRTSKGPLSLGQIDDHLNGYAACAAFHPRGPREFVVIDVDRHNAIQAAHWNTTLAQVRKWFPASVEVVSSSSGGRHFYVKLPANTMYEEAALILQAFFALERRVFDPNAPTDRSALAWRDEGGNRPVRATVIEVPVEPPRLPFGPGATFVNDGRPIAAQVADFLQRLASSSSGDFDQAKAYVYTHLKLAGSWTWRKQEKLERFIELREVSHLQKPAPADRLTAIAAKFHPGLRRVTTCGVPAFGTRTKWMQKLAAELGRGRSPHEAADLLVEWIESRPHVSEDIEQDRSRVVSEARRLATRLHPGGVPTRIWKHVRRLVQRAFFLATSPRRRHEVEKSRSLKDPSALRLDTLLLTAFEVLQDFYQRGVRERAIHHRQFGRYHRVAHDVELLLTHIDSRGRGWIVLTTRAVPGISSRQFRLLATAWPVRPGERVQYSP